MKHQKPGRVPACDAEVPSEPVITAEDRYLRLAADFDNFRKRTRRESAEQSAAEKMAFIAELLPLLDHLERALACERTVSDVPLRTGVELALRQVGQLLLRHGIETLGEAGQPFDPHRHEAIAALHKPALPDGVVLEVMQRGYCCGEKVLRPARVVVNDWNEASGNVDGD